MAIQRENDINVDTVLQVAHLMAVSARTAPKARGNDNLEILVVTGNDLLILSEKMKQIGETENIAFFIRDAENVKQASAALIIATKISSQGLKLCGMCGFKNCTEKNQHPNVPCIFNTHDLGIAIGSACSVAANHHIDNRVMYTIGQAALAIGYFTEEYRIAVGLPLAAKSKNPFFDRSPLK